MTSTRNAPPSDLGRVCVVRSGESTTLGDDDATTNVDEEVDTERFFILSCAIGVRLQKVASPSLHAPSELAFSRGQVSVKKSKDTGMQAARESLVERVSSMRCAAWLPLPKGCDGVSCSLMAQMAAADVMLAAARVRCSRRVRGGALRTTTSSTRLGLASHTTTFRLLRMMRDCRCVWLVCG